jgi:ESS family glutamate:Na+ symporter
MIMTYITAVLLLIGAIVGGYIFVRLPLVRRLFFPSSLAAGVLLLIFGPQIAGQYFPELQIPTEFYTMWKALPQYMIVLVFAGLFLGKPLLSPRKMWNLAGPQVAFGQAMAWGQYVIAGILTLLVLTPVFGLPPIAASLLEISFEGGHGTVAGMTPVFNELGFEEGRQVATGLATASLVTALVLGVIIIAWGRRRGYLNTASSPLKVARNKVYYHTIVADLRRQGVSFRRYVTFKLLVSHVILLLIGVALGWLIHQGLLLLEANTWGRDGGRFFVYVPLFTFAMFGGLLAQLVWKKLGFTVVREIVELITTLTLTLLIMAAIGTMSLEFLSHNAPLFIMLYGAGVLWILFMFFFMAKRMFKNFWFQNAIVSFGQGMGMTATGLLFAQMVDPKNRTNAVEGFGYKQLMFEPLMGGGMVTALSMPIILLIGLPLFTAICAGVVVFWLLFGLLVFGRKR